MSSNNKEVKKDESELKLENNESSAVAINQSQQNETEPENFYYDELDRKCTLRRTGSKIILYRARTNYKGKKLFDICIILLGLIGLLLFILYIIICARRGWSKSNFHDIDSANRITLVLVAIFIIFISLIGILGTFTYWKPIILMTSLLTILGFVSHCYLAKKFMDITRFADRDMALQWWDSFTDEEIMSVQKEYNCCGYLNYKDHGFVTPNCPNELVIYEVPQEIYQVAKVKKNDSYQRKFGTPENPKNVDDTSTFTGTTTTTVDETTNNTTTGNTTNTADTAAQNTENTTTQNNNNNDDDDDEDDDGVWRKRSLDVEVMTTDEQSEEAKKLKQEIDLGIARISKIGKGSIALPIKKREINVEEDVDDQTLEQLGEDIKNSLVHGQGKIFKSGIIQKKRHEPVFSKYRKRGIIYRREDEEDNKENNDDTSNTQTTNTDNTNAQNTNTQASAQPTTAQNNTNAQVVANAPPGCKDAIVEKVKSGVTPLYIVFYALLIVYVLLFIASVIYWWDMRNEKEYDEFS